MDNFLLNKTLYLYTRSWLVCFLHIYIYIWTDSEVKSIMNSIYRIIKSIECNEYDPRLSEQDAVSYSHFWFVDSS